MDDNDAKNTGGSADDSDLRRCGADGGQDKGLKIMVGSGADGSTAAHGTQAPTSDAGEAGGRRRRIHQGGTTINAEVMGWMTRSVDREGKYADLIAVSGDPLADT
jgi:imidazolonepropionase-like amidohydrolase